MISRIETIDDLTKWLEYIAAHSTPEDVTGGQFTNMIMTLKRLKPHFPCAFKQCCKCQKIYPETKEYFDWSGQGRTGLHAVCKVCRKKYQKKHKKAKQQEARGEWSPEYVAEVNRIRALAGKPPLQPPAIRKPGRPKKKQTPQTPPQPGEAW